MPDIFKFKEFIIHQDRCAMKVGTDAVLLGSWVSLDNEPEDILDIGSGTGVIALQLAQRSNAGIIDAVEIDDEAYEQCAENFENSPWSDRLFCYHASLQEYASEIEEEYDLIISNPPFYTSDVKSSDAARNQSRFEDSLPFEHLMVCVSHMLGPDGIFAIVVPRSEEDSLLSLAADHELFPRRICRVKGHADAPEKRSMIEFTYTEQVPVYEELVIEIARHQYTPEYIALTAAFYLDL